MRFLQCDKAEKTSSDSKQIVNGYLHPLYAQSLAEFGTPLNLPRAGAWILQRTIPGQEVRDAMGCYPLLSCCNWSALDNDLDDLGQVVVSVSAVTDPFGDYHEDDLKRCFRDVIVAYKKHYVADLTESIDRYVDSHHRYYGRRASRYYGIERCTDTAGILDEWTRLYADLIERHSIRGIAAFSKSSFAGQLTVPGIEVFRAVKDGVTAGMSLWYLQGDVAYYHLSACSDVGYKWRAPYGLMSAAFEYFKTKANWLCLGAGAGVAGDASDGLNKFKEGWSSGTRQTYFCGRICNHSKYDELVRLRGCGETRFFPAYRQGEFG